MRNNKCIRNDKEFLCKYRLNLDASVSGSSPRTNDSATPLLSLKGGQDTTPLLMRGGEHGDTTTRAGGDHLIMDLEPPIKHFSRKDNVSKRKRSYVTLLRSVCFHNSIEPVIPNRRERFSFVVQLSITRIIPELHTLFWY